MAASVKIPDYQWHILCLFDILAAANTADSTNPVCWTKPDDATQRDGLYGHIYLAIVELAGTEIYNNWVATNEVDLSLANRKARPAPKQ